MKNFFTILFFLFLINSGISQDIENDEYYKNAQQKIEQGKLLDALAILDKAIQETEPNSWYYIKRGEIYYQLNHQNSALENFSEAVLIDPENSESYNRLAGCLESYGHLDSAIALYGVAATKADNDTMKYSYLMNAASVKVKQMKYTEAISELQIVLEFNPNDISALNNISTAYKKTGKLSHAVRTLEHIINIDTTFIGPYINLGLLYTEIDEYEKALPYFNKAAEIDSTEGLIYSNRGYLFYKMKMYNDAIRDINLSLKLYPTNSYAYKNRALTFIAMNRINEACRDLQAAEYFNYEVYYGNEVQLLRQTYCLNGN